MGQAVMHFELIASDTKKLREFYARLFAWRPEDFPGMDYAMLHSDAKSGIDGGLGSAQGGLPPGLTIYVQVDEVETFLDRAKSLGAASVLQEPYDVPGVGRFAVFTDPEGNRVGLWKLPQG